MPLLQDAKAAEEAIHQQYDQTQILSDAERKELGLNESTATAPAKGYFHPLQDEWAQKLTLEKEKVDGLSCYKDCKERDRIRRLECDEVRKRVEFKLKELGCPTVLVPNDPVSICGEAPTGVAPVQQQQQQQQMPMMPMPWWGYPMMPGMGMGMGGG